MRGKQRLGLSLRASAAPPPAARRRCSHPSTPPPTRNTCQTDSRCGGALEPAHVGLHLPAPLRCIKLRQCWTARSLTPGRVLRRVPMLRHMPPLCTPGNQLGQRAAPPRPCRWSPSTPCPRMATPSPAPTPPAPPMTPACSTGGSTRSGRAPHQGWLRAMLINLAPWLLPAS